MDFNKLLDSMAMIVIGGMKAYKTDFYLCDIPALNNKAKLGIPFRCVWVVRKTGTHVLESYEENKINNIIESHRNKIVGVYDIEYNDDGVWTMEERYL